MSGVTFDQLKSRWNWTPIRDCPGRFVLRQGSVTMTPEQVAGDDIQPGEFHVTAAKDAVLVARLAGGGLISYRRTDGTYVHTLNTADGFERKLQQLGIDI